MRSFLSSLSQTTKWLLIFGIAFYGALIMQSIPTHLVGISVAHAAENGVEVWWPSEGATLEGTQPFKAILKNRSLGAYKMYWQVDSGGLVSMEDNQADYPHKEALVDLSGWNWNADAMYRVSFIAQDNSGRELSKTVVNIKHPAVTTSVAPSSTNVTTSTNVSSPITNKSINIWWPTDGTTVSGVTPLKAVLENTSIGDYKMYWSAGGALVEMQDSYVDYPHKEYPIDFTNWTWKGSGPYGIAVTAKDRYGNILAQKSVSVYVSTSGTTLAQTSSQTTTQVSSTLSGEKLYVDPNNPALSQANTWRYSRPADAAIMDKIGAQSTGLWLGGWNYDVTKDVSSAMSKAASQNSIATFVAYNIPNRDCGSYSAGGVSSRDAYLSWIRKISEGLGSGKAIVILEPDAISLMDCLSQSGKDERLSMISSAVDILKANSGTKVYLDAGHSGWLSSDEMASRLSRAGLAKSAGFALNTSNFVTTAENASYGDKISKATNGAHFLIDTSRNGSGSNGEWCNPAGRSLGQKPTLSTGNSIIDAYLWVKKPGESDGNCNGGPSAGVWWPEYALDLAKRAGY